MSAADLSIIEAGAALRQGRLTALELTQAHLDRIAARNGQIQAFTTLEGGRALKAAAHADRLLDEGRDLGPLHGIPVALKDIIDTAGLRTTYGSRLYEQHVPGKDACVVERLRAAGAVVIGKVATYEFATVGPSFDTPYPPPVNPRSPPHITGGSSSGSAAAVAAGMVRTAIGTDTGGSVRSPGAYCGIVGLKPTYGRISTDGVFPLSPTLDHVGILGASVAEAAITADALISDGPAITSCLGQPITGLRIGYAREWFANDPATDPGVLAAIDAAVSTLSLLGASIEEVTLPPADLFEACGAAILHAEAFAIHRQELKSRPHVFGAKTLQTLVAGVCLDESDLEFAVGAARHLRHSLDTGVFARFDALVTATTLAPAPPLSAFKGEEAVWTAMRTIGFNVTGHPALSVPAGFVAGRPVGLQIAGPHGAEAVICRIGDAFERNTDHTTRPVTWRAAAEPAA